MNYQVVEGNNDVATFEMDVEKALNDGWEFAGPLVVNDVVLDGVIRTYCYQPMIKK